MPVQQDQAIVLRLTEFSETSQIGAFFTSAHGQLHLIAKGSRRGTKQRAAVGLDLLEWGDLGFAPARGEAQLGTLTDWAQRDAFAGLRCDLLRLYAGLYAAELVTGLTEVGDPHPELFAALLDTLQKLASSAPAPPLIPRFQKELLRSIGYLPNLRSCVDCGRNLRPGHDVYFSARAGGLLCRDCEMHHAEKLRWPAGLAANAAEGANWTEWFRLLNYHLTHTAGRPFQTATQLGRLLAAGRLG